ncbi:2TM domain-containing protein [Aureitalea sp. L0-47]|uniref:2TM domain-containing protein n=1 Tax=Aureitalea sp. L0-47 TaxID=2816962 RepID=UPI0022371ACC|nr:2TM domain-containing protein [Aureitalea sp. L0-47]MCW5519772.1 2TM domain-containing protein [Aureitalea sp. L0-47]
MEPINKESEKYQKAKKRVDEIKGFYTHLTIYLFVNAFLMVIATGIFDGLESFHVPHWEHFTTPFFWGIGLAFHGLYVFQFKTGFFKKWEERKIKEYMDKDLEDKEKYNNNTFR